MRWFCGVLGVCAGCSFTATQTGSASDGGVDAGPGADGIPRTCEWDYEPAHFDPCELRFGEAPVLEAGHSYLLDTDDHAIVDGANFIPIEIDEEGQGDGVSVAIWAVDSFDFPDARLRVEGARSLVIVSDRDLIVRGQIDASGITGTQAGGADHVTACVGSAGAASAGSGGGGGGGAFTAGALGQGGGAQLNGGAGGGSFSLLTIRGGCEGGDGGANGGTGGRGGGAVYLAARNLLRVDALINAGGGGGEPGAAAAAAGGGGGGAGGQIGLEADQLELSSVTQLIANGGGGGGGGASTGTAGMAGSPAPLDGSQAPGGVGGAPNGGPGGLGGADALAPTTTMGAAAGGGGGGGGARGRIVIRAGTFSNNAKTISPSPAYATF